MWANKIVPANGGTFQTFLKRKLFWSPFLLGHWYPCFGLLVASPLGFKVRVTSLIHAWQRHMCYIFPEIHLWCDTCRPLVGHHGSQALSSTYLQGIGGTQSYHAAAHSMRSGRRSTDWAIPARLIFQTCMHPVYVLFLYFVLYLFVLWWIRQRLRSSTYIQCCKQPFEVSNFMYAELVELDEVEATFIVLFTQLHTENNCHYLNPCCAYHKVKVFAHK